MLERLAPIARRTAISFSRRMPRARSKPAKFAQAMSSARATAPCSIQTVGATSPTISVLRSVTSRYHPFTGQSCSASRRREMASTSARAVSRATPGPRSG